MATLLTIIGGLAFILGSIIYSSLCTDWDSNKSFEAVQKKFPRCDVYKALEGPRFTFIVRDTITNDLFEVRCMNWGDNDVSSVTPFVKLSN